MNYKKLLEEFFEKESNRRYALPIFEKLIQAINQGWIAEIKKDREKLIEKMPEIFEKMKNRALKDKEYAAHLFPTIISLQNAPNFYIGKEAPTEYEIYKFFYLLITGIHYDSYIVNLDNVDIKVMQDFRDDLIKEEELIFSSLNNGRDDKGKDGLKIGYILSKLGINTVPEFTEFIFSFIIVSYFLTWIKRKEKFEKEELEALGIEPTLEKIGIRDDTTLVVFNIPREKKKMYYIPKLNKFFSTWYREYLEDKEKSPSVVKFIFSTYVADKEYKEISASLLDKFLYYFLNGHVNGELLNKLINIKISYELKKQKHERICGFTNAKYFFRKLSRDI